MVNNFFNLNIYSEIDFSVLEEKYNYNLLSEIIFKRKAFFEWKYNLKEEREISKSLVTGFKI